MGLLSALARRGARAAARAPDERIFIDESGRIVIGDQHALGASGPGPRWRDMYFAERRGPMAMGMADLMDRRGMAHSLPFDMGLAAAGGGAGILGLNRLALVDRARREGRGEERRVRTRLSDIRRAERFEDARQIGYLTGLEQAHEALARNVANMYQAPAQEEAALTSYPYRGR